ncbi:hypothetical protein GTA08_BOTSDO10836 [Botryosphaeria dothidea]|uniref:Uncharacterized protein n=1 Tax=Botryosphaeria dothidea TaxID=55169 RepID=A0A8H4IIS0_9PEZI|nr:hypothetical protein GTA08_BOTSDO10836 [Botryosphaeria dothidea]
MDKLTTTLAALTALLPQSVSDQAIKLFVKRCLKVFLDHATQVAVEFLWLALVSLCLACWLLFRRVSRASTPAHSPPAWSTESECVIGRTPIALHPLSTPYQAWLESAGSEVGGAAQTLAMRRRVRGPLRLSMPDCCGSASTMTTQESDDEACYLVRHFRGASGTCTPENTNGEGSTDREMAVGGRDDKIGEMKARIQNVRAILEEYRQEIAKNLLDVEPHGTAEDNRGDGVVETMSFRSAPRASRQDRPGAAPSTLPRAGPHHVKEVQKEGLTNNDWLTL